MSVQVTSLNTIKRDFSKDVYIHSKTHDQKPIIIMDMGRLHELTTEEENILYRNTLINTFNIAINHNPINNFSIIILFSNSLEKKKTKIKVVLGIIKLLKTLYVEQLHKCFIVNMPKHIKFLFTLMKPFIGKKTKNKIIFKSLNQISLS